VPVFPPAPPVTIVIDGRRVAQYVRAFVAGGRVYAPVWPTLYLVADRVWVQGSTLVVERHGRSVRAVLEAGSARVPRVGYVALAAVLRGLGDTVGYLSRPRILEVRTPAAASVGMPTPFRAPEMPVSPRTVFTPEPVATTRPRWTGSPLPRRTPLPFASPRTRRYQR
jgi:hypothetical protein